MTMSSGGSPVRTALVLAGGKGERLRPLTDDRPKPMVPVNGTPILEHHLRWLRANGIERAVLLVGYLQEVIRAHFSSPRIDGLLVECVGEDQPLGRGGAFRNGFQRAAIQDELVVATNGDVLTDQPLEPLVDLHSRSSALATLLLTQMVSPFGVVESDHNGLVTSFVEKPKLPVWINGGVYVLSRDIFPQFPEAGDHETTTFPILAQARRIAAFHSTAFWKSIESSKDLQEVEEHLAKRPPGHFLGER